MIRIIDRPVGLCKCESRLAEAGDTGKTSMTPQEIAERSAELMWSRDEASRWLGVSLDDVGPGWVTMTMMVEKHHINGHGICHGGFIFTLADAAFAFACNSYNQLAVAHHNTITFVAPAALGDRLTAQAKEVSRKGRGGIYDVRVTGKGDELIAEFRGVSRTITGTHFDEQEEAPADELPNKTGDLQYERSDTRQS